MSGAWTLAVWPEGVLVNVKADVAPDCGIFESRTLVLRLQCVLRMRLSGLMPIFYHVLGHLH